MTKEKKQLLEANFKKHYVEGWDKLLKKLITYGGEMIMPRPEPAERVQLSLKRGRIFDNDNLKLKKGRDGCCHENASKIWARSKHLKLITGYALMTDGEIWQQHTWLWNTVKAHILETTFAHKIYFGVELTETEAHEFAFNNVPEYRYSANWPAKMVKLAETVVHMLKTQRETLSEYSI